MSEDPADESDLQFKYDTYEDDFQELPQENSRHKHKSRKHPSPLSMMHDLSPYKEPEKETRKPTGSAAKLQTMVGGSSDREKLIEHNIKLKTQIFQLSKQMDEILSRDHKRRRREVTEEDDESLKSRKLELRKQQVQIQELKNKIMLVKRQLDNVYDNRTIISKEDNLKSLKNELKVLEEEKAALMKIKREQNKALRSMKGEAECEAKIVELKSQLAKVKEESKELGEKLAENERILRKNHEQYIIKQNKIKEMEQKMQQNKDKDKFKKIRPVISSEMIEELELQIQALEKEKRDVERHWQDKIAIIDQELHQKRTEEERKLLILKQKEKELKINEIRIKELKRLIKHNAAESKKKAEEDPKLFRYRRNIKHLDSNH